MLDFRLNDDISVFLGCGLGGTSLVNANVSLPADKWVFEDGVWPKEILQDYDSLLADGFRRATEMLKPQPYPQDYPALEKLTALQKSAAEFGGHFYRPPINVNFKDGVNHVGVDQKACNGCGDCVSGCNTGAKNTVLMNYLPDARNCRAEIFTQTAVRWVSRTPDGKWLIHFQALKTGRETFNAPLLTVRADVLILSAGTLGSTEILLRSREKGLALSTQLGRHFTGNGDVLAFGYNCDQEINGTGFGQNDATGRKPVGPCITGIIDLRGKAAAEKGMVIEEGSIPGALAPVLAGAMSAAAAVLGKDTENGLTDAAQERLRELDSAVRGAYHGAVLNSQTYLVMAHDNAGGTMKLEHDRLRIDWPSVGNQPIFAAANKNLEKATVPLGGTYVKNPMWSNLLGQGKDLITVHPLGGYVMGQDASRGVVNHKGQVFSGTTGTDVHEGLYVADGSVVPRSLGVNPLLTISALAERTCALLAADRRWTIRYDLPSQPSQPAPTAEIGIQFTETMRGFFSTNASDDYKAGYERGKTNGQSFQFTLTVRSTNLDRMLTDPSHRAEMIGTVNAPPLSDLPLEANEGQFTLLDIAPNEVKTRRMTYRMKLVAEDGQRYFFEGFKRLHNDKLGFDLWDDATTLFMTVRKGDAAGALVGRGILKIEPLDFMRQLTTMQVTNAKNSQDRLTAMARFGRFFAGSLWDVFGNAGAAENMSSLTAETSGGLESALVKPIRKKRPLRAPIPQIYDFLTTDNTWLRLTRYEGGRKGPVLLAHGLGVSSRIFSTDTIETNLVEFLCAHDFDVWNLDFRASIVLPSSRTQFDGDVIASQDYPAAVAKVRAVTGADSIQAVVHCFGSTTWFMAMLTGLQGVRSFVCSQIATHCIGSTMTSLKTGLHLPELLAKLGVESLDAYAGKHPDWLNRLYDAALLFYPIPLREWCVRDICRRIAFMYAPLYNHANLTEATHDGMEELFGVANTRCFEHLGLIGRKKHLVGADGSERYLPHLDRLNLPICFIHGAENQCFALESTKLAYDELCARFAPDQYSRHVIPGYGHIDCIFGKNAFQDVFPFIVNHLDKYA
jgi:cholesterol oxidase